MNRNQHREREQNEENDTMFQTKENDKTLVGGNLNQTEIGDLPDKEFKAMVIQIQWKLQGDENTRKLQKEETELKNTVTELKNTLEGSKGDKVKQSKGSLSQRQSTGIHPNTALERKKNAIYIWILFLNLVWKYFHLIGIFIYPFVSSIIVHIFVFLIIMLLISLLILIFLSFFCLLLK